ncbi:aminotransferase class V-fold PLP-dependent enzyme [Gemella sp. GH3]|uniref:aminotransferase class V-fold PLP-dependent enzyme n=1 Tax=unclassified Gemella TaxID=2624949 RepID=UPI0015D000F1|nr:MULTISPECIES: aminotransferase class V-fold PLP-dependent enzyme [unclassified Gemella]MBF0713342.1 aminotransferase class V-fold PLP-dependent enzyme [Gemella sp. GH3.1]NYS50294.1 aminotransferase class V-fold PLP-dependent enzyme [Gemella sp. GH3]
MTYYFDYGATSLKKPEAVAKKVYEILSSGEYANPSRGSYKEANNAFIEIYKTRKLVADFFGISDEKRVIFTNNATEALNIAIKGVIEQGDHIITTKMEHNSVLRPIYQLAEKENIEFSIVDSDKYGVVLYDDIEKHIKSNTKLLAITQASNLTGNIVDLKKIATICQKNNILLLVDGSQAAGVIDTKVEKLGIDLYCFTGHKSLFAPQGVGGLCIGNPNLIVKSYNVGGSGIKTFEKNQPQIYPEMLEAGTHNTPSIAGLAEGIKYILDKGIDNLYNKQLSFANKFYNSLKDVSIIEFYGNFNEPKTATVALNFKGVLSSDAAEELFEKYNIAIRAGAHCAPLMHKHFGTVEQGIVRFSFSSMTTEEEVDYAIESIKKIASELN